MAKDPVLNRLAKGYEVPEHLKKVDTPAWDTEWGVPSHDDHAADALRYALISMNIERHPRRKALNWRLVFAVMFMTAGLLILVISLWSVAWR